MTKPPGFTPASQSIQMTKGGDVVATLCDREAKGIAIAIHIDPVQSLVMSRCVTLAPKPIPRARVIHTPAAFQGGDDRLLYVFSIATIPPEIESDKTYGSRLELVETKGVRDPMVNYFEASSTCRK